MFYFWPYVTSSEGNNFLIFPSFSNLFYRIISVGGLAREWHSPRVALIWLDSVYIWARLPTKSVESGNLFAIHLTCLKYLSNILENISSFTLRRTKVRLLKCRHDFRQMSPAESNWPWLTFFTYFPHLEGMQLCSGRKGKWN